MKTKRKRVEGVATAALGLVAEYWKQRSVVLAAESKQRQIEEQLRRLGIHHPTSLPWELENGRTLVGVACEAFCSSMALRNDGETIPVGERVLCVGHRHGNDRERARLVEIVEQNTPTLAEALHTAWQARDNEREAALAVLQDLLLSRGDALAREKTLEEITDEALGVAREQRNAPQAVEPPEVF